MSEVTREEFQLLGLAVAEIQRAVAEIQLIVSGRIDLPWAEEAMLAGERLEAFHQAFARRVYGHEEEEHEA